jgi:hypothetical protein
MIKLRWKVYDGWNVLGISISKKKTFRKKKSSRKKNHLGWTKSVSRKMSRKIEKNKIEKNSQARRSPEGAANVS